MNLTRLAEADPGKPAIITAATGAVLTYAELDSASRRLAAVFDDRGLAPGDAVAILMENCAEVVVASLAAQRRGLLFVPVNWHLSAEEGAYVVADSGAKALIVTPQTAELATTAAIATSPNSLVIRLLLGRAEVEGFESVDLSVSAPTPPLRPEEPDGYYMFYSSGTTGRPKGIKPQLSGRPFGAGFPVESLIQGAYRFGLDTRYLAIGPLYHAAPLGWSLATIALGGTAVIMPRFDAQPVLENIEKYRITHAQFVPTMFVRMLKLPDEIRAKYDISSLKYAVHAAAPCPVDVKQAMIDWFGPIVYEYYAASEGICFFAIDSAEWLTRPGSVGRALQGIPHVLDEDGKELPAGEIGQLWFEADRKFEYHNDPEKTKDAFNDRGWSTLGDMGSLDEDGFLFLADRRTDLILSGGVNIYPREVEDALAMHPEVADVAVIGIPDPEWGQQVKAVVQLADPSAAGPEKSAELLEYLQGRLARFKQPRSIDFVDEIPRLPSGKVLRRVIRERYLSV